MQRAEAASALLQTKHVFFMSHGISMGLWLHSGLHDMHESGAVYALTCSSSFVPGSVVHDSPHSFRGMPFWA